MSQNPDFGKDVQRMLKEVRQLVRELPALAADEILAGTDENFQNGGFYGEAWKPRQNDEDSGRGILIGKGSGRLRRSFSYRVSGKTVFIESDAPYAEIHNEGGPISQEIKITPKMRKFFWAKFYETGEEKWKWMARSNKAIIRIVDMPQRQFIGEHPEVEKRLNALLEHELIRIFG